MSLHLPKGWAVASALVWRLACPKGFRPDQGRRLKDTLRWECRGAGSCCHHTTPCKHGEAPGSHRVGPLLWELKDGLWGCQFQGDKGECRIHPARPLTCRLYPLGINLDPAAKVVYIWAADGAAQQCPPCADTAREQTVEEYLDAQGATPMLQRACAAMERGNKLLL